MEEMNFSARDGRVTDSPAAGSLENAFEKPLARGAVSSSTGNVTRVSFGRRHYSA
jgi:hypothetical protein